MSQIVKFIGYHGTHDHLVRRIFSQGLNEARKGYLGKGVYFFEDNYDLAREWALSRRDCKSPAVIKAQIECDHEKVLDITNPNCPERKLISSKVKSYFVKRTKDGYYLDANAMKEIEGNIIDNMCEVVDYKLIRAITISNTHVDGDKTIFLGIANGIELCVKDKSIMMLEGVV